MAGECVRVAMVTIQGANPDPQQDLDNANIIYLTECGSWVDLVDSVVVDRPDLLVIDQDDCLLTGHNVSDDEDELFDLGRDLGADIVCYYINGDTAGFAGCAAHPPDRRGFWVGVGASQWTFAHEVTHVLGRNRHVSDTDNLMFTPTANITNPPPDLTQTQCDRVIDDPDVEEACVLAAEGKLTLLRVHELGTGFGPPSDQIDGEVVIRLDTEPGRAFGFQLRDDANEGAHRSMLDLLRDAFNREFRVRIDYLRTGINNGLALRVVEVT
jgi:hypothetical protein